MASFMDYLMTGPFANSSMAQNFLHPDIAYNKAGNEYSRGWRQARGYQEPFWKAGTGQIPRLTGAQDRLMDPAALQTEWAKGYEQSPYAQDLQKQAKSSGLDAASSMGLMGSSAALNNIQQSSSNIMNADRQKYMDDLMEKYKAGIGIGENIYGKGATAGSNLSGHAMDYGKEMGEAAYGANASQGEQFKQMMQILASIMAGG